MKPLSAILSFIAVLCLEWLSIGSLGAGETSKKRVEALDDRKEFAGTYVRGEGKGREMYITLQADSSYYAARFGDEKGCADGAGKWAFKGNRVSFTPKQTDQTSNLVMQSLDAQKLHGECILVPTEKEERERYDKEGPGTLTCFQKPKRLRGKLQAPKEAKEVAGRYGWATRGYRFIKLEADGSYVASERSCLGIGPDSFGRWRLRGSRITFQPTKGDWDLKAAIESLDVLRYQGEWLLLPTKEELRWLYDLEGVSCCFRRWQADPEGWTIEAPSADPFAGPKKAP